MCVWMKGEKLCGVKKKACKVELSSKPTPNLKNPLWGLAYLGRLHGLANWLSAQSAAWECVKWTKGHKGEGHKIHKMCGPSLKTCVYVCARAPDMSDFEV